MRWVDARARQDRKEARKDPRKGIERPSRRRTRSGDGAWRERSQDPVSAQSTAAGLWTAAIGPARYPPSNRSVESPRKRGEASAANVRPEARSSSDARHAMPPPTTLRAERVVHAYVFSLTQFVLRFGSLFCSGSGPLKADTMYAGSARSRLVDIHSKYVVSASAGPNLNTNGQ